MEIDPAGSYFSTKDFVGPGGQYAMLGFGSTGQPNMESYMDNPLYGLLEGETGQGADYFKPEVQPGPAT